MDLFPDEFFDVVIIEHCAIVGLGATGKNIVELFPGIYQNCKKTIKKSGEIRIDYLVDTYYYHKYQKISTDDIGIDPRDKDNYEFQIEQKKQKIIREVLRSLKKIGFPNSEYQKKWKNKEMIYIKK